MLNHATNHTQTRWQTLEKMKKIRLITLIVLFLSIKLFSQENESKKIKFGITFGTNLFDLNRNEFFDQHDGKLSYSFGISIEFMINEKLSLLSNVNYDRKIMVWDELEIPNDFGTPSFFTVEDKIKFSYINIPIFLRYYIGNARNLSINAGGFYNHSLNIENESIINETGEETILYESENIIKKYDFGILFGIAYRFELNDKNRFTVELRNELGLADIAQVSQFSKIKTNTIKLILNWELPL